MEGTCQHVYFYEVSPSTSLSLELSMCTHGEGVFDETGLGWERMSWAEARGARGERGRE